MAPTIPDPATLSFPPSSATVSLKLIRSFVYLRIPSRPFYAPAPGSTSDETRPLDAPGKAFLLERADGTRVVFDLGCRKDLASAAPAFRERIESGEWALEYGPDVAETLVAHGVDPASISAVIWSHSHFDHTGNPDTFPKATALVVGPGTQAAVGPGWPHNPAAMHPESDFEGREVREVAFVAGDVGGMPACDFFGDGSFYLLDAPGHCVGHMLGLARVTPSPAASFVVLGGDTCHHPAMLRPTVHAPLPAQLRAALPPALAGCEPNAPFLALPGEGSIHHDPPMAANTLARVHALDAHPDVWVLLSHDSSVDAPGVVAWFPEMLNDWKGKEWKEKTRWLFLEAGNAANRWEGL